MTFKVMSTDNNNERKIIGTVWANEESQASAMASALWGNQPDRNVTVRPSNENREIPLYLPG